MPRIPGVKQWKVTFHYKPGHRIIRAIEYVYAPTKLFALWAAREQRHGCTIRDPNCIRETVGLVRKRTAEQIDHDEELAGILSVADRI